MFCGNLNDVHSSRMDLKSSYCHVFWSCRKQNSFFMYYFDVTHKKKSWMVLARNKSIMCLGRWCCCTFYGLLLCFTERRCQNLFYQWGLWLSVKKTTLDPGATHVKEKKNGYDLLAHTQQSGKHRQREKITGRLRQKHSKRSRWGINGRGLVHMQLGWRVIQSRCAGGWGRSGDWEWQVHWGYCSADGSGRIWSSADEKADNENIGEDLLILWQRNVCNVFMQQRCDL